MATIHSFKTRAVTLLACAATASLLASCGPPNDGYYDSNGRYVPGSSVRLNEHYPALGGRNQDYSARDHDRRYYNDDDRYGDRYYAGNEHVPANMLPPRGKCRVWFTNRSDANQPPVESCKNIRDRAPRGSFVIYGE